EEAITNAAVGLYLPADVLGAVFLIYAVLGAVAGTGVGVAGFLWRRRRGADAASAAALPIAGLPGRPLLRPCGDPHQRPAPPGPRLGAQRRGQPRPRRGRGRDRRPPPPPPPADVSGPARRGVRLPRARGRRVRERRARRRHVRHPDAERRARRSPLRR